MLVLKRIWPVVPLVRCRVLPEGILIAPVLENTAVSAVNVLTLRLAYSLIAILALGNSPVLVVNVKAKVLALSFQNIAVLAKAPPLRFMMNPTSMLARVDDLFRTVTGSLMLDIVVSNWLKRGLVNPMGDLLYF